MSPKTRICKYLSKLSYFTNLDFPEIRGPISLPKRYLLGEIGPVFSVAS